jgi:hypothetical protein
MASIKDPQKVLPIVGFIFVERFTVDSVLAELKNDIGDVMLKSETLPFTHTHYYDEEMGDRLTREWRVFEKLLLPDRIVQLKQKTNEIEKSYVNEKGGRKVNIDPGLLSLSSLVLASTKNYSHRIYLGRGIYGEVTLIYKNHRFHPLEWTYPDYREKRALDFFCEARKVLKNKLMEDERCLNYQ